MSEKEPDSLLVQEASEVLDLLFLLWSWQDRLCTHAAQYGSYLGIVSSQLEKANQTMVFIVQCTKARSPSLTLSYEAVDGCYEAMQEFHQLFLLNSSFTLRRRLWQNRGKPRILMNIEPWYKPVV